MTLIIQFYFAVTGPRSCKSNGHPAITKEFLWRLPIFHFLVEISVSNGYVSIENLGLLKRSKRPKSTMFPDGVTSGQKKKLQNRFGPTSKAETGILAYTEQEIIWVYLRPNQFKASNRTCYLIT